MVANGKQVYISMSNQKLLLISVPKSGTNMLTQAIGGDHRQIRGYLGILREENHPVEFVQDELKTFTRFARVHLRYNPEYLETIRQYSIATIFLYRDPRDIIVSRIAWIKRSELLGYDPLNIMTSEDVPLNKCSDPIKEVILTSKWYWSQWLGWLDVPDILHVKYEDLVTVETIVETYQKIIDFMSPPLRNLLDCTEPATMIKRINPAKCSTFRKGIIGDWKTNFTKKHTELFWSEMSEVMERLGYER